MATELMQVLEEVEEKRFGAVRLAFSIRLADDEERVEDRRHVVEYRAAGSKKWTSLVDLSLEGIISPAARATAARAAYDAAAGMLRLRAISARRVSKKRAKRDEVHA